jgi:hypothetical protein
MKWSGRRVEAIQSFGIKGMFDSAKLKVQRADQHINDLEEQLGTFTNDNFWSSVSHHAGAIDITFTAATVPHSLALTLGDVVHNLWSALGSGLN